MRIQNVNMAVPVGSPAARNTDHEEIEAELSAEMHALQDRCIHAVRQRSRLTFTQQQRHLRQQQFDVELKGIVKRLASSACSNIADRDVKADLRARLYTDLSTVAQTISKEAAAAGERHRRLKIWWGSAVMLMLTIAGVGVWLWQAGML